MIRYHRRLIPGLLAGGRAVLPGAVLVLLLGACSRQDHGPLPAPSPPQPKTFAAGHIQSAILTLDALPAPPRRGIM